MFIPYKIGEVEMIRMRFRPVTADIELAEKPKVKTIEGKPSEVSIAIQILKNKYGQVT